MTEWTPRQQRRLKAVFTDLDGAKVDPTAVTFKIDPETGTGATFSSPSKDAVGEYHQDVTVEEAWAGGRALWGAYGTGAAIGAGQVEVNIAALL